MKTLLINPSSRVYEDSKVKASTPDYPPLNLLTIASPVSDVTILDMNKNSNLKKTVEEVDPDMVGITSTTPLFSSAYEIIRKVKEMKEVITIIGGSHVSSVDVEGFDYIIKGEGDFSLITFQPCFTENLDNLPMPDWNLIRPNDYKMPDSYCKKSPVAPIETSRGCPYGCVYCSKSVFGRMFRAKSPRRVIKEIEYTLDFGFREIHIIDDGFSNDIERAKKICDDIKKEELDFLWALPNGIRIDRIDKELLEKMYSSGCYWIAFGVESGDQRILNKIKKGITLSQVRDVFKMAKNIGFKTEAFFMLALPGDTKETMQKTIDFAKELEPDIAKFDVCTPLPGTPLFNEWVNEGRINTNWKDFMFHKKGRKIFNHPNLDWETIDEYYDKAYREFYLRPKYILRRLAKGSIITDFKTFINTRW